MKKKVNWSNTLQGLLDTYQDVVDDPECQEVLKDWKQELDVLRYFLTYFGYFHLHTYQF